MSIATSPSTGNHCLAGEPALDDSSVGGPLVGRAAELESIDVALELLARGAHHGLAFVGEPGIGKTALIHAARVRACGTEVPVLTAQATEFEATRPFGVFVDALDGVFGANDSHLAGLGDDQLAELGAVFPSLARGDAGAAAGLQLERFRFHSAVRNALAALAAAQPLVLALDDLHWADRSSSELLAYLLWHGIPGPALLLLAYRPSHAPDLLTHAVAAATREGRATTLELEPLTPPEAAELLGPDLDDAERWAIYRESGGNPFYLLELARFRRTGGQIGCDEPRDPNAVPAAVRASIHQELTAGSAEARRLLEAASVVGEPFEFELATGVAGLSGDIALDALDELGWRGLIRTTDVPSRYAFRHPIVRGAVYESAGAGFTLTAHRRAAELLERWGAAPVVRAHHVERSARVGDLDAANLLVAAANDCAPRAPTTAAGWLAGALHLLPEDVEPAQRLELLIPLATALGTSGRVEESRERLAEALALLGPDHESLKARLVGAMARIDHMAGQHGEVPRLLARTIAELGDDPSPASTALRLELAMDHWFADNWEETVEVAMAARADADRLGDRLAYATAAGLEAIGRGYLGQVEPAAGLVDECASTLDELSDSEVAARVEAMVVLSHAELASIERASDSACHADRGIAITRATGQDTWYPLLMFQRCVANLALGRLAEASEAAESALQSARLGYDQTQIWALTLQSWVDLVKGDVGQAVQHGEEAVALLEQPREGLFDWLAYGCLAKALLEAGQPERARDMILQHGGGPELTRVARSWLPHWYATLTFAELAAGQVDAAQVWVDRSQAAAAAFPTPGRISEERYARAALELHQGRPRAAVTSATEATRGFLEAQRSIDAARSRILAARGFGILGECGRAIDLLQAAYRELDAAGARGYREEAAKELVRFGQRVSPVARLGATPDIGPDVLSRREHDVAELVATGLTNRQIAEHLFVSPKTVESHMTRILRKVDLPSRAALAATIERWHRETTSG